LPAGLSISLDVLQILLRVAALHLQRLILAEIRYPLPGK
jgi:hypothetical protein